MSRRADRSLRVVVPERLGVEHVLARVYGPSMALANVVGAAVVFVFLAYVLPVAPSARNQAGQQRALNVVAFLVYMAGSLLVGALWGRRVTAPVEPLLASTEPPGAAVREAVLTLPWRQAGVHATLWAAAAGAFGLLNLPYSAPLAAEVAGTIVLGGFTTCALGYLVAERTLRPVVSAALLGSVEAPRLVLGVRARVLLAWALGTGIPLLGVGLGLLQLGDRPPLSQPAEVFLVVVTAVVGALAIAAATGAVSDPIDSVAQALREVGAGRLEVFVPVYDASEVGQLQAGFNAMVVGLREREQLRDLYGRQVGADVARLALEHGVHLGGQRLEAAVLFVDVVGSTGMAETLPPEEVVAGLNAFFAVVVEVVTRHGGWVNKFEGDAALCLFGAPAVLDDAPDRALAAARELVVALAPLPLDAAVGVSAGVVVAGHVGAESRFEYTVIGDPVNVAARLTDLAKTAPGRVLADDGALSSCGATERAFWQPAGAPVLRGRAAPTQIWATT